MARRTLSNIFVGDWAPFFNVDGHLEDDVDFDVECTICGNPLAITRAVDDAHEAATVLPCGHIYGSKCIKIWFDKAPSCPTCRGDWRHRDCYHKIELNEIQGDFNLKSLPPIIKDKELPKICRSCSDRDEGPLYRTRGTQGPAPNPADRLGNRLFGLQQYENMEEQLRENSENLSRIMGQGTARRLMQMIHDLRPHVDPEMSAALGGNSDDGNGSPRPASSLRGRRPPQPSHPRPSPPTHQDSHFADGPYYRFPSPRPNRGRYSNAFGSAPREPPHDSPHNSFFIHPEATRCPRHGGHPHEHQFARHIEEMEIEEESPFRRSTQSEASARWQEFASAQAEQSIQDAYPEDRHAYMRARLEEAAEGRRQRQRQEDHVHFVAYPGARQRHNQFQGRFH